MTTDLRSAQSLTLILSGGDMDIPNALTAASTALTIAKQFRELDHAFDKAAHRSQVLDLMEKINDLREALIEAQEEMKKRDATIEELKVSLTKAAELVDGQNGYRYIADHSGSKTGYPACPTCEQSTGKIVQLIQNGRVTDAKCPVCATEFKSVTGYIPGDNGRTYREEELRLEKEARERTSAALARLNRGY